jgi:hypothetical protein
MYFVNTNETIINEFIPSRILIAELAAIESLSAISANIGNITAGVIQSDDYSADLGFKIDMDDKSIYLGGNSTPVMKFYQVGANKYLDITATVTFRSGSTGYANIGDRPTSLSGINSTEASKLTGIETGATNDAGWRHPSNTTKIDGGDIYVASSINLSEGGRATFGNQNVIIDTAGSHGSIVVAPDGGPTSQHYAKLNNDDLELWYWNGSRHQLYNSMTRIESGVASANTYVTLPGIWKTQPKIMVSPNVLSSYNASYPNQSQSVEVSASNITATGNTYYFYAKAALNFSSGSLGVGINRTTTANATDFNSTTTGPLAPNTRRIVVTCTCSGWYEYYYLTYSGSGEGSSFSGYQIAYKHANYKVILYYYLAGVGWTNVPDWQTYAGVSAIPYNTTKTFTFDTGVQSYDIQYYYIRWYALAYDSQITDYGPSVSSIPFVGYRSNIIDVGYSSDLVGASALAYGSLNWLAVGR